jgi:hypothetical protein
MNLLYTAVGGFQTIESRSCLHAWPEHAHLIQQMPLENIPTYLQFEVGSAHALVDAIVCMADMGSLMLAQRLFDFPLARAINVAKDIRDLPGRCTMRDGRKWKSVPFIVLTDTYSEISGTKIPENVRILRHEFDPLLDLNNVQGIVDAYYDRVLGDYDSLGMMVRVVNGRAQIGPAMKRKNPEAETELYCSAGDQRRNTGWVTVKRDRDGLRHDVQLFEELLNRGATETEMHRFFEEHPAILMEARMGIPVSHQPKFAHPSMHTPDYSFVPILPATRSDIELMEMKGTNAQTFTQGLHPGFAANVNRAIDQVRDYDFDLRNPVNFEVIQRAFGYIPSKSKLAVLIGRSPRGSELEWWQRRQESLDVEIITYDKIFETQTKQLERPSAYTVRYGTSAHPLD